MAISNLLSAVSTVGAGTGVQVTTTGRISSAYEITSTYTIATLPTPAAAIKGARAFVSNGQTTPTWGGAVSTTGAVFAPVYCDGVGWFYG